VKQNLQKRQDWIKGRRKKRKLARQARLRRQVFRYTVLFALIFVAVSGFVYLPWSIKDAQAQVQIHGNQVASDEQIRRSIKDVVGTPLYKLDPEALQQEICKLPIVKYAFVRRSAFPHPQLRVEVLEEFPWATVCREPDGEPYAVVSQTGRLIPIADFPGVVQPPLRLCADDNLALKPEQIAQWDGWVRLIAEQLGEPVSMVDLRHASQIVVQCPTVQLHIGQADSSLTRRLNRIASVVPVSSILKDKLKYIDLSLDSNIPLKVDKEGCTAAQGDELLRQAVRAVATTQ
jgi:cell division septal protein FtsQ